LVQAFDGRLDLAASENGAATKEILISADSEVELLDPG
jgi:hypothetical protein